MLLYLIVFATGLAGMTQLPWGAAAVGACMISLKLMIEDRPAIGAPAAAWEAAQVASNLMIGVVASVLAFGAGRLIAAIWGL